MKFIKVKSKHVFLPKFFVAGHKIVDSSVIRTVTFLGIPIRKYLIFRYLESVTYQPHPIQIFLDKPNFLPAGVYPMYKKIKNIKTNYIKL